MSTLMNRHITYGLVVCFICVALPKLSFSFKFPVLDPRVGYDGLKREALRDPNQESGREYLKKIEAAKESLKLYFIANYSFATPEPAVLSSPAAPRSTPRKFNFFSIYGDTEEDVRPSEELDKVFQLKASGFGRSIMEPVQWWKNHQDIYPNVSRLARDILSIPGKPNQLLIYVEITKRQQDLLLP
jgi:hypothetical protein